jgi:hypothetical protein
VRTRCCERYAPIAAACLTCSDWCYYAIPPIHDHYLPGTPDSIRSSDWYLTIRVGHSIPAKKLQSQPSLEHAAPATGTADVESLTRISPSLYGHNQNHHSTRIRMCGGRGPCRNSIYSLVALASGNHTPSLPESSEADIAIRHPHSSRKARLQNAIQ